MTLDTIQTIALVVTTLISAASVISAATPTRKDDAFMAKVLKWIDLLAINFGYAKDK